ncbi:MAG: hypothetical protein WCK05_04120 [Planctomycetota bacterium]
MSPRNLAGALVLLAYAAGAHAESFVTLTPATETRPSLPPYRMARLTVAYRGDRVVQALSVRDDRGGLTVLRLATIAPGASATIQLPLPATSTQQAYRVRLLAGPDPHSPVLFEAHPLITWPGDVVEASMATLIDPHAYDRLAHLAPVWPGSTRRHIFLLAALGSLALVATMFIPRSLLRLAALLVLAAAGTLAAAIALNGQSLLFVHETGPLTVVSARRTTTWANSHAPLVPLYAVNSQLGSDTTILGPDDMLQTIIRPDAIRLFARPDAP